MQKFEQGKDWVKITTASGDTLTIPLDWFLTQDSYDVVFRREYVFGIRHSVWNASPISQEGGPLPWDIGDRYIANMEGFRANYDAFVESQKPAELQEPDPEPNWSGLLADFTPGNQSGFYEGVRAKVAIATDSISDPAQAEALRDTWNNLKLIISTSSLWDVLRMETAIKEMSAMLTAYSHPLSSIEVESWNNLMTSHQFPDECKLLQN